MKDFFSIRTKIQGFPLIMGGQGKTADDVRQSATVWFLVGAFSVTVLVLWEAFK